MFCELDGAKPQAAAHYALCSKCDCFEVVLALVDLLPLHCVGGSEQSAFPVSAYKNAVSVCNCCGGVMICFAGPFHAIWREIGCADADGYEAILRPDDAVEVFAFF